MTPTNEAFETLMPEPAGFRTRYRSEPDMIGHYPWTYAEIERRRPKYDRPECEYENLYTAAQMRQMFDAATERAAKLAEDAAESEWLFGSKQSEAVCEQIAAAIRAGGEKT